VTAALRGYTPQATRAGSPGTWDGAPLGPSPGSWCRSRGASTKRGNCEAPHPDPTEPGELDPPAPTHPAAPPGGPTRQPHRR